MFSFIKIKNPNLRVFITICVLVIIFLLIQSIIKLHLNPSRYKNIYEAFVGGGSYSSEKCEARIRNLKEDELFHKVKNVDIVYMWVDGSDTKWQSKMNSKENSRNRSNDELVYSLRSITKFMPWHEGRIFIVTPNQTPSKLNTVQGINHTNNTEANIRNKPGKEVIVIDQNSIMPDEVGNTANSFIIEVFLHRIPTLSDNFIYMNDDYFIGQPLLPSDFFTLNGDGTLRPKFYSNNYQIKGGIKQANEFYDKKAKLWLSATYNTNGTIDNYFKSNGQNNNSDYSSPKRYYLEHAPYMFNKSWCEEVYKIWENDFRKMYEHKKRHWKDLIFVLLYRYYCIESAKPCDLVHDTNNIYLKLITNDNDKNIQFYHKVTEGCPKFFTLNDEYTKDDVMVEMSVFLEEFFSEPSPYEKINMVDK